MAIIDWPTGPGFDAAQFALALDVSESVYQGFHTGNRTRASHAADRLRGVLTLPPVRDQATAARRAAILLGLRSNGDWLRMGLPQRRGPLGALGGSITVSSAAAAGARSVAVQGGLASPNLIANAGFEIDTSGDGVADGWVPYVSGAVSGAVWSLVTGVNSPTAQSISVATVAAGAGDQAGVTRSARVPVAAGAVYSFSADFTASSSAFLVELYVDWYNAGGAVVGTARQAWPGPIGWTRRELAGLVAPAGAASAQLYAWLRTGTGAAATAYVDNVQFQLGAVATPYAGLATLLPGDVLSIGGNLLLVGAAGATLNDAGAGTVPLVTPLQRAVAGGAAVTYSAPTGLWELDDEGLQLDYSAANVQRGLAVPLRQVIA